MNGEYRRKQGMAHIYFEVPGIPQSRGSKRAFPIKRAGGKIGVAVSDMNPKSRDWMACVRAAALEVYKGEVIRDPVVMQLSFYFPRPKCHFGTGKNAGALKPSAPRVPAGKPDLLKLARGIEDALIGICYHDDALIVVESLRKCYGEPARAEVVITKF